MIIDKLVTWLFLPCYISKNYMAITKAHIKPVFFFSTLNTSFLSPFLQMVVLGSSKFLGNSKFSCCHYIERVGSSKDEGALLMY